MNLLAQFQQIFNAEEKAIARITHQKADGLWVGETLGGGIVILKGSTQLGKLCFYNRVNREILSDAPDVAFEEYSV